jgi:hypothetical protein
MSRQFYRSCPNLAVLDCLHHGCAGCLTMVVLVVLSWLCWLSYHGCAGCLIMVVLAVLPWLCWLSYHGCVGCLIMVVLVVLSWLCWLFCRGCVGYPAVAVLSRPYKPPRMAIPCQLSYTHCPVTAVLYDCPAIVVMQRLITIISNKCKKKKNLT